MKGSQGGINRLHQTTPNKSPHQEGMSHNHYPHQEDLGQSPHQEDPSHNPLQEDLNRNPHKGDLGVITIIMIMIIVFHVLLIEDLLIGIIM